MSVLVWAHTFPARRHLGLFFEHPSLTEGWKGFGATAAIVFYLLAPATIARLLARLWRAPGHPLAWMGLLLAVAHLVPVTDHLPRFVHAVSWADGWRGLGALMGALWFLAPLPMQGRAIRAVGKFAAGPLAKGGGRNAFIDP